LPVERNMRMAPSERRVRVFEVERMALHGKSRSRSDDPKIKRTYLGS
jgi:hypothetical protein